jgi:hypothetical protein
MNGMRVLVVPALCLALAGCTSSRGGDQSPPPSARAGFGGPSSVTEVDELRFHTPSKNIYCSLTRSAVRCDIAHRSWQPPAKPADCKLDWGNGAFIDAGKAGITCTGDTLIGAATENLPYGRGLRSGSVLCTSESAGLTCKDEKSGRGFTLAVARYRVF